MKQGMLTIKSDQLKILEQAAFQDFEERMVLHIREFFPDNFDAMGEADSRLLIQHGIEQAALYGFVSKQDVCKFIDLMVCFGAEFDTDVNEPWAKAILSDNSLLNASDRMDALFNAGMGQLDNRPS